MRTDPLRLQALKQLAVLDTTPEVVYDDITRTLAQSFGVPIAMVNLLDAERDWFKSCLGLPLTESPAATSFCEIFFRAGDDIVVIEDTTADDRFVQHPLVSGAPFIRFYAAARLTIGGFTVGTLCVYDTEVRAVTPAQVDTLKLLGQAAMETLALRRMKLAAPDAF